ncbi:DUF4158 domain-containing protein [Streptomyces sp. NPDC007164]|uniref:DUF4158 domain-containing protein n=1 Tax=Streptomyces sp. NPDC007164 TaxID=3156918 RepID=UPI0033E1D4CF
MHADKIQKRFEYRDFTDQERGREFRSCLYGRAWTHAEGPMVLFNHAVTWLRENRGCCWVSRCWPGRCRRPRRRPNGACTTR